MSTVKVRNRLRTYEEVVGATVTINRAGLPHPATATTNRAGIADVPTRGLPDGSYTLTIVPANTTADPVGPLIAVGTAPDRIFRSLELTVTLTGGEITGVSVPTSQLPNGTAVAGRSPRLTADIQPVWMRSPNHGSRGEDVKGIIIHHTAGERIHGAISEFLGPVKSIHYMIDIDGQILKMCQDSRRANHAGEARWQGTSNINSWSIGIEIVHRSGPFPEAQYTALIDLLNRLKTSIPTIEQWKVVGHHDVGTNDSGRLGRKSGCPGSTFEWVRVERLNLGMLQAAGPFPTTIYGGFFGVVPGGSLQKGDNDRAGRAGGAKRTGLTGSPVQELQQDLADIGYSVGTPDGDFGDKTFWAVKMIQEHFFAGSRGHKAPDGVVDQQTAFLIRGVALAKGAATTTSPVTSGAASGGGTP